MKLKWTGLLLLALPLLLVSCGRCSHKETEWVVDVEATCAVAGTEQKQCSQCGEILDTREYEVDHMYDEGVCVYCGTAQYGSSYFEYREITVNGESGYEVIGIGNSTALHVEIPALKGGKPILSVAAGAFAELDRITSVSFGKNVQQIGASAFLGCTALEEVVFAEKSELKTIGTAAFSGCTALGAFSFPAGVTEIPTLLFEGCTALSSVTLHEGIVQIGDGAFAECEAMIYEEIGGAKYLGTATSPHFLLVAVTDRTVSSFTVPEDTKLIGEAAFLGSAALREVSLPEGLCFVGAYGFAACGKLASLTLPEGVAAIGAFSFAECAALESVSLPETLTDIGEKAFYRCTALAALALPSSVRSVGQFAFLDTALVPTLHGGGQYLGNGEEPYLVLVGVDADVTALTLPAATRVVADGALAAATQLTALVLGDDTVTLGKNNGNGYRNLTAVTLPQGTEWLAAAALGTAPTALDVSDPAALLSAIKGAYKNCYIYRP